MLRNFFLLCGLLGGLLSGGVSWATNFTVTTTNDNVAGSLRDAITQANAQTGPHFISFTVTGTITLAANSPLPELVQVININGDTLNDGIPDIVIDGVNAGAGANGLVVRGGGSTIRGLQIVNFTEWGIILSDLGGNTLTANRLGDGLGGGANDQGELLIDDVSGNQIGGTSALDRNVLGANNHQSPCSIMIIEGTNATGNIVQGNYIGVTADGESESANCIESLLIDEAPDNFIGGDVAGAGNVLSGGLRGLFLGSGADRNIVQGNLIGTDKDGMEAITTDTGILLQGNENQIGGTTPLARNVISGNTDYGIFFGGSFIGVNSNKILGNFIGTDITGTGALPNGIAGVHLQDCNGNFVGGAAAGERNVISGNTDAGVEITSSDTRDNQVVGNFIGLDAAGTGILPNAIGVRIQSDAHDNLVGGLAAGAGNVVSGNSNNGIRIEESAGGGNLIQGNFVGTNPAGTVAMPNGSTGIFSAGALANTIGGSDPAARNLVSGNIGFGIHLAAGPLTVVEGNFVGTDVTGTLALPNGNSGIIVAQSTQNIVRNNLISGSSQTGMQIVDGSSGNQIFGNKVGTDLTGTTALPNAFDGILVNASGNFIGGNNPGEGNLIAFNGLTGVLVQGGQGNRIWGNSIFENDALGISLNGGAGNLGQPAPALSAARIVGMQLNALGTLNAAPNTNYTLQFFSNQALDPTGFGEGQVFLGEATVTTDGAGVAAFDVDVAMIAPTSFNLITATATDPNSNTSEFSNGVTALLVGSVQFSATTFAVDKDAGTATILVTRSGGSEGDVQVDFATSNGTCTAGVDYESVSQTLNFPAGVTNVEVTIPILDNPGNETFCSVDLDLSNPQGGTLVGFPGEATLSIQGSAVTPIPPPIPPNGTFQGGGCAFHPGAEVSPFHLLWFLGFAVALKLRRKIGSLANLSKCS